MATNRMKFLLAPPEDDNGDDAAGYGGGMGMPPGRDA
jgi:hypothetical protein